MIPLLLAAGLAERGASHYCWLAAACLTLVALALTLTRAAWLVTFIELVIFGVAARHFAWRRRVILVAAAVIVVASAGFLVSRVGTPEVMWSHVIASADIGSGSPAQRLYIWSRTRGLSRLRPRFGSGMAPLGT